MVARVIEGGDAVFLGPVGLEVAEGLAVEAADEAERMRIAGHALQIGAVVGKVAAFLPEMRDDHLRTNDFLEADKYPTIAFNSTKVEQLDADTVRITGDLTIKQTTRQVSIDFEFGGVAQDPFGNTRIGFEVSAQLWPGLGAG